MRRKDSNRLLTNEEIKKLVSEGRIIIRNRGYSFEAKQRANLYKDAFCKRYKCRICGRTKDIQIHHLNEYAPKQVIDTYEDFIKIPWIPLCQKCHMIKHNVFPPETIEDD